MSDTRRIAMWSGPRNISTAMMRAWENRGDTRVIDEPFYAFYLARTGERHPGAAEVIAHGETDWQKVIEHLTGPISGGVRIFYQKQMTHHLLPEIDRSWLTEMTNCFLIRDPRAVIASYLKKNGEPDAAAIGFPQQQAIFEHVRQATGQTPPIIDAADVLKNPERMMRALCESIEVDFDEAMLSWPAGPRASDGIWARYWYAEVEQTTGFQPYREPHVEVPARLGAVYEECRAIYDRLHRERIH